MTHQVLWHQRATRVNHVGAAVVVTGVAVLSVPGSEILMDIVVIFGISHSHPSLLQGSCRSRGVDFDASTVTIGKVVSLVG